MTEYKVREIPAGSVFSGPVFLEDRGEGSGGFVLNAPPLPFSRALRMAVFEWEWGTVYSGGAIQEQAPVGETPPEGPSAAGGEPGPDEISRLDAGERARRAREIYGGFLEFAGAVFGKISLAGFLDYGETAEKMSALVRRAAADPYVLFKVIDDAPPATDSHVLAEHGAKTAVISLITGLQIKLPPERMVELGVAALLHEVELLYLPARIHRSRGRLSQDDSKQLFSHPAMGYKKLQTFNFPVEVCRAVLEHHECQDGSGYPRRITGDKICLYAKIIAPVCTCLEVNGTPVRRDIHTSLAELLKNSPGKYDETVIKALQYAVSRIQRA